MQPESAAHGWRKATGKVAATARELAYFLLFAAAYIAPLLLDNVTSLGLADTRVRELLDDVLATPSVRMELVRNLGAHLLLLAPVFAVISLLSRHIAAAIVAAEWATRLLMLLVGWLFMIAGNSLAFPTSNYSIAFSSIARPAFALGLGALLCCGILFVGYRMFFAHRRAMVAFGVATGALVASGFGALSVAGSALPSSRNVIIVGVDSMSAAVFDKLDSSLPNLRQLMDSGVTYQRAYTPLGRTFPAWVSILSGKSPVDHGALFNLRNMNHVGKEGLISGELQSKGYRTVYAIDERRFNNIGQDFGFDHVIGPSAGALDFLLQQLNDTPLSNLVMQSRAGKLLMPYSYINTASHTNYDADAFVESVLNKTAGAGPLFLAVHFESAHFPFATRHADETFSGPNGFWNKHAAALTVVDRQVGQLLNGLAQQGFLDNALVIVLSDHGEGLGEAEATVNMGGEPTEVSVYGHGSNVLSDHSNHIVLGVVDYKKGRPAGAASDTRLVSLLDLKSLISRYAVSGDSSVVPSGPCIMVETGLRLARAEDYRSLNAAELAADSAGFYEIDAAGRMRLREDRLRELVAAKDVGVRCEDHITYLSTPRGRYFSIGFDQSGMPATELALNRNDIRQIEAYRSRMLNSIPAESLNP